MPVFESDDVIECIWYVYGNERDFLAVLYRKQLDSRLRMEYRFRYYSEPHDSDPFAGNDVKNWYSGVTEMSLCQAMVSIDHIVQTVAKTGPGFIDKVDKIIIGGSFELAIEKLKDYPWFHMKVVQSEEKHGKS